MIASLLAVLAALAEDGARPPLLAASVRYRGLYVQYGNPPGCDWIRLAEVPAPARHPQEDAFRPGPFSTSARRAQVGVSFGAETSWHVPMMTSWSIRAKERSQGAIGQLNALVLTCEPVALSQLAWQKRLESSRRWERQFYMTYWVQYAYLVLVNRYDHDTWLPWVSGKDCIRNRKLCDLFLDEAYAHWVRTPDPDPTP